LAKHKTQKNRTQIVQATKQWSAPLPPPEVLAEFNNAVPGAADRILQMAESQSSHRQKQENRVILSNVIQSYLGMIFAFILGTGAICGGIFLIYNNKDSSGLALIIADLVALVSAFIWGRKQQRKERDVTRGRRR